MSICLTARTAATASAAAAVDRLLWRTGCGLSCFSRRATAALDGEHGRGFAAVAVDGLGCILLAAGTITSAIAVIVLLLGTG